MLISLTSTACFFSRDSIGGSKTKKRDSKVLGALLAGGGYEKRRAPGSFAKEVSSTYLRVFDVL